MRKLAIIAVAAGFVFTSCKKDYTCTCTVDGETATSSYSNVKKKDAQDACDTQETTYQAYYSNVSCSI